ncbi:MAG: hypothetical protein KME14_10610 [Tildeniella torsiva UHER 1998/13D]|jgi:hypothetical protein|nr:hypothetical protein [Tildeniella torsiva UHER 1998/13D]
MGNFFDYVGKRIKDYFKGVPGVGEVIAIHDKDPYKERLKHISGRAAGAVPRAFEIPDFISYMIKSLDAGGISLDDLSEVDARELYLACGGIFDPRLDSELDDSRAKLNSEIRYFSHPPNENPEEVRRLEGEREKLEPTQEVLFIAASVRNVREKTLGIVG